MAHKLRRQAAPPPPGVHRAMLDDIREVDGQFNRKALRFQFTVTGETEHVGAVVTKVTSTELIAGNSLDQLASAMLGRDLADNDEIDLDEFLGQEFEIVVASKGESVALATVRPVEVEAERKAE